MRIPNWRYPASERDLSRSMQDAVTELVVEMRDRLDRLKFTPRRRKSARLKTISANRPSCSFPPKLRRFPPLGRLSIDSIRNSGLQLRSRLAGGTTNQLCALKNSALAGMKTGIRKRRKSGRIPPKRQSGNQQAISLLTGQRKLEPPTTLASLASRSMKSSKVDTLSMVVGRATGQAESSELLTVCRRCSAKKMLKYRITFGSGRWTTASARAISSQKVSDAPLMATAFSPVKSTVAVVGRFQILTMKRYH
ncbi:head morphogenesis protein [Klebsiella phage vB_KshKPC-M]|nr:head morphogenesis protein [Klebsiella phage vB_KshKPC-M]